MVKAIMRAENQRRSWNDVKKGMGQKRTPAPTTVETLDEESNRVEFNTKESVEAAIHGKTSPRFSRT